MPAIKTNIGLRRRIVREYNKLPDYMKNGLRTNKIKEVMKITGASYYQVYNVINGRVKTNRSARADKGKKRTKVKEPDNQPSVKKINEFDNPDDFLEHQFMVCLEDLQSRTLHVETRVSLLEKITRMQKNLDVKKLEAFIRKPEARLIIRIMRRLNPKLDEDKMKKIYAEEYEKLQRDLL